MTEENDSPKKNLPAARPPTSVSLSRAKTLIRLTNEVLGKREPPDPELLFRAVKARDAAEVKRLLAAGADPNAKAASKYGGTVLKKAAWQYPEIVEVLLSAGANPNVADNYGWTALHTAASWGHAEVVKVLLSAGANPNAANNIGITVLDQTTGRGQAKVVRILKEAGAR